MSDNIYSYIKENFGIEITDYQFKRDYIKEPLKKGKEFISYEDAYELYIVLNLGLKEISQILNIHISNINRRFNKMNLKKSKEDINNILKEKTLNYRKTLDKDEVNEITNKIKQTKLERYGDENYNNSPKMVLTKDLHKKSNKNYILNFINSSKQTKLERYGDENYNNREKAFSTMEERYGEKTPMLVEKFVDKFKNTNLERYGTEYPMKNPLIKEKLNNIMVEKYGVKNPMFLEENIKKVYNSKLINHTINSSSDEEKIYSLLLQKFIDVKRQYYSKKYPFACDFYIPELDLYIEYQGTWTHGPLDNHEPYDINNDKHKEIIKLWENKCKKSYNDAIYTWTIRDPLKRETAKKNNLNWIEFFNMNEFMEWYKK